MSILYLLIPIGIIFLLLAILFFFWAIKNGQYDDMESQAMKIVIEDNQLKKKATEDLKPDSKFAPEQNTDETNKRAN